ncbi:MAG: Hsp20/alpha crystallin family protein [Patescibacteria group bacterium]
MAKKLKLKTEEVKEEMAAEDPNNIFSQDGELVVDVFETNSHFMVLSAIAGVQIKDLDISVEKEMMIIRGQRQDPHEHPEKKYFYQECYWGPFSRKIVLPENIDTDSAEASMDKGVLLIKIPKIAESAPESPIKKSETQES